MKTRLMTLVVMMAVSISSFSVMAQNAQDVRNGTERSRCTCTKTR